jgi:TPR repeat protein
MMFFHLDAKIESRSDLNFRAIELDRVLASFDYPLRANVVILDACRDNPLTRSFAAATRSANVAAGLAAYNALGTGTLIAFSTAPGAVAEDGMRGNSPFTASLVKHLPTPGVEIRQMLTRVRADVARGRRATGDAQVPWDNSSLRGDVYLAGAPAVAPALDEAVWESLKGTTDVAALRGFAVRYPGSRHRDEAMAEATKLEPRVAEDRRKAEEERKKLAALPSSATPAPTPSTPAVAAIGDCNRFAAASLAQINAAQAVPACRAALAVRPNDSTIKFQLGRALTFVRSNEADTEAERLLQDANRNGVVGAASTLGVMYQYGRGGLPKDEREALRLYKFAADRGSAPAQVGLGVMYHDSLGGLAEDEREAVRLFELAADQGYALGQTSLGLMYERGRGGLAKDEREAVRLYKLAADQGLDKAKRSLERITTGPTKQGGIRNRAK